MKRRSYNTKPRPARRQFDIILPDEDDEYELIIGDGDKQASETDGAD